MTSNPAPHSLFSVRATELFQSSLGENFRRTDRFFAVLMLIQYFAGIAAACLITPYAWSGTQRSVHIHVYLAVVLGALLAGMPLYLIIQRPGHALTRHVVAMCQLLYSGLLVHLTGGRIETHFHVFGSLAFLAYYRDWRVLLTATIVTALDHALRGIWWPLSVYGVATAPIWRTVEHAAWVIFADVFFFYATFQSLAEMKLVARHCADLEDTKADVEAQVVRRTQELEVAKEAAESASKAKSEFLANMSHELRTPLTAIMGFAESLQEPDVDQNSARESGSTIVRNSEHLLSLINDVLDLSKVESGKFTVHPERCDIAAVLNDVASIIHARAAAKSISFGIEFGTPIPRYTETDPTRVRQILINLLGNAVKFTLEGGVRLVVRHVVNPDNTQHLQFDVVDTGIGISEVDQASLFQPFSQADATTSRRFGGTGLGLAISRRLAQFLGGEVVIVDSAAGLGTRFRLSIEHKPVDKNEFLAEPPMEDRTASSTGSPNQTTELPYRILVAEDGPDNLRLILHILRKLKARTVPVQNGKLAVDFALESLERGMPFDAILMDMQMPEMDGYDATRILRQEGYTGPIIALTAHAMAGDRGKCLAAGCDDFLTKPINRSKFAETIRRCIEKSRTHMPHVFSASPF